MFLINTSFIVAEVFDEELAAITAATAPRGNGELGVAAAMIGWLTVHVPTRVDGVGEATTVADTVECWVTTGSALIKELIFMAVVVCCGFATVTPTPLTTGDTEFAVTDDKEVGCNGGCCCFHILWTGIP